MAGLKQENRRVEPRRRQPRILLQGCVSRAIARKAVRKQEGKAEVLRRVWPAILLVAAGLQVALANAQQPQIVLDRGGSAVVLEPYAPNIIRVTLSRLPKPAKAGPGYGFIATPSAQGWTYLQTGQGDTYRSPRLVVTAPIDRPGKPQATQVDIGKFFSGSAPGTRITISAPDGRVLLDMTGWSMSVPNHKDGNAGILNERRPSDAPFYQVGATFVSPHDEHYYGLGQNHEGFLDHRGHTVRCWHDYNAAGGPSIGVPFLVTNRGYGMIWDNPSKTTIEPGFNEQTQWTSEVGDRVSFFVIAGSNTDEIYSGYRQLTGATPLLPKAAYGYIQCKQRYASQEELVGVARGYRQRHLPADVLVVDWFYYTKMGQMDFDREKWPDPLAMNRQLHDMGFETMISVWPRFTPGSRYYDLLARKGWFERLADGTPTNGLPYDRAGSDIDTTNPQAARWFWEVIRDNIISKGFDALWADETEPDLPPNGSYFHIGPGARYFNVYPLLHTAALYDGFRRDTNHRALILSRDAYLGAQRNGTIFWSSDIYPTWDTLKRQIPTGLDFAASGLATGVTTPAAGSICPPSIIPSTRPCSIPPTPATTSEATTTTRSFTPAGSSTQLFCPSSALTAAASTTNSGPTASRPNPFCASTSSCVTS
jgi:alpha-D-xyloside xylohydrolase